MGAEDWQNYAQAMRIANAAVPDFSDIQDNISTLMGLEGSKAGTELSSEQVAALKTEYADLD
jgi:hypothetical protein